MFRSSQFKMKLSIIVQIHICVVKAKWIENTDREKQKKKKTKKTFGRLKMPTKGSSALKYLLQKIHAHFNFRKKKCIYMTRSACIFQHVNFWAYCWVRRISKNSSHSTAIVITTTATTRRKKMPHFYAQKCGHKSKIQ